MASDPRDENVIPFPGPASEEDWPFARRRQPELQAPRAEPATYRVRVDLDGLTPAIWRRLELASDLTLDELHHILQVAMGWADSHLHRFEIGPTRDPEVMHFVTDFDESEGDVGINERHVRLDQVLGEAGDRLFYQYDFGDSWDHTLELEAVTPYDGSGPRASCTDGRYACPPEDCGGVPGYTELLDAIAHPESADAWMREQLDWRPDGFDPVAFSVEDANARLAPLLSASSADAGPKLADLQRRSLSAIENPLTGLVAAADLHAGGPPPDPEAQERMVRPWLRLMALIGPDGLTLTKAGFLPPAAVVELADVIGLDEAWMGKLNREEHTPPVADLRESAVTVGLVRKLKGRLLLTRAGQRLADDPQGLWRHLVEALPLGKDYQRDAGLVALLATACGEAPGDGVRRHGPEVLSRAGWRIEGALHGGLDEWDAYRAARPTLTVLRLMGCTAGRTAWDDGPATDGGRALARAALRGRD